MLGDSSWQFASRFFVYRGYDHLHHWCCLIVFILRRIFFATYIGPPPAFSTSAVMTPIPVAFPFFILAIAFLFHLLLFLPSVSASGGGGGISSIASGLFGNSVLRCASKCSCQHFVRGLPLLSFTILKGFFPFPSISRICSKRLSISIFSTFSCMLLSLLFLVVGLGLALWKLSWNENWVWAIRRRRRRPLLVNYSVNFFFKNL